MQDLQEVTHEIHYENYRSEKLQPRKQLHTNEVNTDEQQKKLIKEKDDEVKYLFEIFLY
jgi:septin family protein